MSSEAFLILNFIDHFLRGNILFSQRAAPRERQFVTMRMRRMPMRRMSSSSPEPQTQSFCCTPLMLLVSKQEVRLVLLLSKLQRTMFPARLSGDHSSSHQRIIGCRNTPCWRPRKAKTNARMRKTIFMTRMLTTVDKKIHLWSPTIDGRDGGLQQKELLLF